MATAASSPPPQPQPQPQAASPVEGSRRRGPPLPPHIKAVAGSLGGLVEACVLQPTDVVKTRLQLDRGGAGAAYRGMAHCGATVWCGEGAAALWKGLTPFASHLTLKAVAGKVG
nr:unnamed protein product [Digitaria exilis]